MKVQVSWLPFLSKNFEFDAYLFAKKPFGKPGACCSVFFAQWPPSFSYCPQDRGTPKCARLPSFQIFLRKISGLFNFSFDKETIIFKLLI